MVVQSRPPPSSDILTSSGDSHVFNRPHIPTVQKPSVITKAWSKILRKRQNSPTAAEKDESNVSGGDIGSEGVVEPQTRKVDTFQITSDTDGRPSHLRGRRVDRPEKFALAQPEPAEQHGPKAEADEYGVETTYVPLLNADGMVVDYAMKRTSSVKAVRKSRIK